MSYSPNKVNRRDSDATLGTDGDASQIYTNAIGRLKVSTQPGAIDLVTGSITTTQPVISTPVAGGTVEADVRRASNLNIYCTGTFAGVNCTFEGSIEDSGAGNWFAIQGVRTNANTVELVTGVLGAAPAYAWELSVNALSRFRVRATARTSGTQVWNILPGAYATEPIPAIQTHAITGSVTATVASTTLLPSATVGGTITPYLAAALTAKAAVKASAGSLMHLYAYNPNTSDVYLQLFNTALASVTVGTTAPIRSYWVPAGGSIDLDFAYYQRYATAITIAPWSVADNTAGAAPSIGVLVNGEYI